MFYLYETEKYKQAQMQEAMAQTQRELMLPREPRRPSLLGRSMRGLAHVVGHGLLAIGKRLRELEKSDVALPHRSF